MALRQAAGLKQAELGDAIGMAQPQISQLELGRPVLLETAVKIADVLGVPLDVLVGRVPPVGPCTGFTVHDFVVREGDATATRVNPFHVRTPADVSRVAKLLAAGDLDPMADGMDHDR